MTADQNNKSHRRYNILTGEWVLVSPHRTKRPWQGKKEATTSVAKKEYDETCYLCPGNTRANGSVNDAYSGTYSFENDFAALVKGEEVEEHKDGLLVSQTETGICKVICFSPNHSLTLPLMEENDIADVVRLWRTEYKELGSHKNINHVQIFENKGAIMGCSNPHPHGQVWSQYAIPNEVVKKGKYQKEYWDKNKRSLLSDYIAQEIKEDKRIVARNEHFIAVVPYWAVWPYEIMIVPISHYQNILELNEDEIQSYASIIKEVTILYDNLFETSFPYSSGIHQSPTNGADHSFWHFHMSFYPPLLRSETVKKFMVGYEMFANPQRDITPEYAADQLNSLPRTHYSVD